MGALGGRHRSNKNCSRQLTRLCTDCLSTTQQQDRRRPSSAAAADLPHLGTAVPELSRTAQTLCVQLADRRVVQQEQHIKDPYSYSALHKSDALSRRSTWRVDEVQAGSTPWESSPTSLCL